MQFGKLLCGEPIDDMREMKQIMDNLRSKLDILCDKILVHNWNTNENAAEVLFYGRNILETSLTALLGRTDPFRLITVYKIQSSDNYNIGKKMQSAVEFTGDIIASEKAKNLWDFTKKKEAFDRALLGNYLGEIIWKPGVNALTDYIENKNITSEWITEVLSIDERANFERWKSESSRLFSSFSKGVHSESLVDMGIVFDSITIKDLVKDLYKLCATLGLISHFIGYLVPNLSVDEALELFCETEETINEL